MLCRHLGCAAAFTEMVSARGLIYRTRNTFELLETCPEDNPLVVQLYGNQPEIISQAVKILIDLGFFFFDLNCGCSVKKVTKTGSGASLMKNPDLIAEIFAAMTRHTESTNCGVKIRSGWNAREEEMYLQVAEKLTPLKPGWITLHPRTAVQLFSGEADWSKLKRLKASTSIPVVASGDLFSAAKALKCLKETGADNIMFARGALNNPAVFQQYLLMRENSPAPEFDVDFLKNLCLKIVYYYQKYCPARKGLLKMRTVLPRIIREVPGARELRKSIIVCTDWESIIRIIRSMS